MKSKHWGYKNPDQEEYSCLGGMTREEAVREGASETSHPTHYEVFQCVEGMPELAPLDIDRLVEEYFEVEDTLPVEIIDGFYGAKQELKPALRAELEESLRAHWQMIQREFGTWLANHVGSLHHAEEIELLEKP